MLSLTYVSLYTEWFKKMDSISYVYISWTIHGMWMIYITFERGGPKFSNTTLERSPSARPCSSISWDQNGYYAVQTFSFTQTAYLLKLVIPTTNAPPRWRMNVETKTKRTLYSSRRLSFNELTNTKNLMQHSRHFALNWHWCTAVR